MQLSHKYETERLELKAKEKALRQKLSECGQREQERENFTSAIRRFMRMDRLTAPLLRELIDHIDVFETEGKGKKQNPKNRYLLPLCRVRGNTRSISKTSHQSRHPKRRCRGVSHRATSGITKEQASRLLST